MTTATVQRLSFYMRMLVAVIANHEQLTSSHLTITLIIQRKVTFRQLCMRAH